jgi:hypothetical protein
MKRYILQILVALDQLGCTIFGGWADETISSYLHRLELQKKPAGRVLRPVVDALARWLSGQHAHCKAAYDAERLRAHCPPELRP